MATQKNLKKDLILDYKNTFSSHRGKRVINDLMVKHYVINPTHIADNPYETAFREGQRFVVLNILEMMRINPENYMTQLTEAKEQYEYTRSHFSSDT